MRSYLFAPGNNKDRVGKALRSDADAVVLDLEDSVAPDERGKARLVVREALETLNADMNRAGPKPFVRVNPLGSGDTCKDLDAIMPGRPDGIILPKCRDGEDAARLSEMLAAKENEAAITAGTVKLIVIATETARSIFGLGTYGGSTSRLIGLGWGAEDLSADIGATANRDANGQWLSPYMLARNLCLFGAHAARVEAIDTVYVNYSDMDGLKKECEQALQDGFRAKMAIHPAQLRVINDAFTPLKSQVDKARSIIEAFSRAGNAGVIAIEGEMFDRPHLTRAEKLVARAGAYGVKEDTVKKPAAVD